MKNYEHIVAEAVRIEHVKENDKLFIVFEIKDLYFKQKIMKNWTEDIEYRLIDKNLVLE